MSSYNQSFLTCIPKSEQPVSYPCIKCTELPYLCTFQFLKKFFIMVIHDSQYIIAYLLTYLLGKFL